MSEVLNDSFSSNVNDIKVPLSILYGEQTAERFKNCDDFLREIGTFRFFQAGRLTPDGRMQVGVFKQGLQRIKLNNQERTYYQPWQAMSRGEILLKAAQSSIVPEPQIEQLREQGDIAVHIMDRLKVLEISLFNIVAVDVEMKQITENAFTSIISSIHGQPINKSVA